MAIPTDFKGITPSAGTTTTFPLPNAGGAYGMDAGGTLTPVAVSLGPNMVLLLTAVKTNAEIVAAMQLFLQRYGAGHEGAGGFPAQATVQAALTATVCT